MTKSIIPPIVGIRGDEVTLTLQGDQTLITLGMSPGAAHDMAVKLLGMVRILRPDFRPDFCGSCEGTGQYLPPNGFGIVKCPACGGTGNKKT